MVNYENRKFYTGLGTSLGLCVAGSFGLLGIDKESYDALGLNKEILTVGVAIPLGFGSAYFANKLEPSISKVMEYIFPKLNKSQDKEVPVKINDEIEIKDISRLETKLSSALNTGVLTENTSMPRDFSPYNLRFAGNPRRGEEKLKYDQKYYSNLLFP